MSIDPPDPTLIVVTSMPPPDGSFAQQPNTQGLAVSYIGAQPPTGGSTATESKTSPLAKQSIGAGTMALAAEASLENVGSGRAVSVQEKKPVVPAQASPRLVRRSIGEGTVTLAAKAPLENAGSSSTASAQEKNPVVPVLSEAYRSWMVARYQREIQKLEERRRVIENTNRMGYVIFVVVHLILAAALLAAVLEFRSALRLRRSAARESEIKISLEGIALKTSIQGTVLLSFALAFYYLFLKLVLPIAVIQP